MHAFIRRALQTALVAGGLLGAGATMANAADGDPIDGVTSALDQTLGTASGLLDSGDPAAAAPVTAPVTVSGLSVSVLGDASGTGSEATRFTIVTDESTVADFGLSDAAVRGAAFRLRIPIAQDDHLYALAFRLRVKDHR